tara:strand:- start:931 stop:1548 length:618 start_codon:yes stop_codon:yes gene_type:complete
MKKVILVLILAVCLNANALFAGFALYGNFNYGGTVFLSTESEYLKKTNSEAIDHKTLYEGFGVGIEYGDSFNQSMSYTAGFLYNGVREWLQYNVFYGNLIYRVDKYFYVFGGVNMPYAENTTIVLNVKNNESKQFKGRLKMEPILGGQVGMGFQAHDHVTLEVVFHLIHFRSESSLSSSIDNELVDINIEEVDASGLSMNLKYLF